MRLPHFSEELSIHILHSLTVRRTALPAGCSETSPSTFLSKLQFFFSIYFVARLFSQWQMASHSSNPSRLASRL